MVHFSTLILCSVVLLALMVASTSLFLRSYHFFFIALCSIKLIRLDRLVEVLLILVIITKLLIPLVEINFVTQILGRRRLLCSTKSEETQKASRLFLLLFIFFSLLFSVNFFGQSYRRPETSTLLLLLLDHTAFELHFFSDVIIVVISGSINSFVKRTASLVNRLIAIASSIWTFHI